MSDRIIRACYDESSIRVYQAFGDSIADSALANGTFISPPFKLHRMTWIKPSFLWMMYRCGWGVKEEAQKRVLAMRISRRGFEWALINSIGSLRRECATDEEWARLKKIAPVRIQWDPDRDIFSKPLTDRAIQIGLSGVAVDLYVRDWIIGITDVTDTVAHMRHLISAGKVEEASLLMPKEAAYPLSLEIADRCRY